MLSYQHGYHAGCFADVVKHLVLTHLLEYMVQKDKPFLYLETHAGRGLYDLHDAKAQKTGEARLGIEKLWNIQASLPTVFTSYLQVIHHYNATNQLQHYPGSPALALQFLREIDRASLCELHPSEFTVLQQFAGLKKRIHCIHTEGLAYLKAALPPIERRGLIFIDPAYEVKQEYRTVPIAINDAYRRFATGTYCLWYPLIDRKYHEQLMRGLSAIGAEKTLSITFELTKSRDVGMNGCGLWIINPPFTLKKQLNSALETLCNVFNPGGATYHLD